MGGFTRSPAGTFKALTAAAAIAVAAFRVATAAAFRALVVAAVEVPSTEEEVVAVELPSAVAVADVAAAVEVAEQIGPLGLPERTGFKTS